MGLVTMPGAIQVKEAGHFDRFANGLDSLIASARDNADRLERLDTALLGGNPATPAGGTATSEDRDGGKVGEIQDRCRELRAALDRQARALNALERLA